MSEDFIIDEDGNEEGADRRPFLIAVGILTTTLIISAICAGVFLFSGGDNGTAVAQATVSARETENAVIAVTNTAVAITIEALTSEAMTVAARPTNTPTATATPVPPTSTPVPTDTPVVVQVEDTPEPEIEGTSEFTAGGDSTPTPIAVSGGNGVGGGAGTLPDTGLETWGALLAAAVLIGILVAARRLRSG